MNGWKEGLTMANLHLKEHKKQWVMGVAFCAIVSMACINFNLTGSIIALPYTVSAEVC